MAKNICGKCGDQIHGNAYPINGLDYCWNCSREIKRETLTKAYPSPESKLLGIIEHIDNLNTNIENQQNQIYRLKSNSGCLLATLVVIVILLIFLIATILNMSVF